MKKNYFTKFIITVASVMFFGTGMAQQDPQYSQYMFQKMVYNPAYAGSEDAVSATVLLRNQWIDFDGHPLTQTFSVHSPINPISSGLGLHLVNDIIGAERNIQVMLAYAYILRLKFGNISLGVNGGIIKKSLDGSILRSPQGQYTPGQVEHNDPNIPVDIEGDTKADVGAGLYFTNKKFDFGFSMTHLNAPKFGYKTDNTTIEVTQVKNWYLIAGYKLGLGTNMDMKPSVKVKSDMTKTQVDVNALFIYRKNIWIGLSYRGINNNKFNTDAFVPVAGLNLTPNLIFGYSYDATTSALRGASSGSHEFMLNYKFSIVKPPKPEKIIYCPRYL